MGSSSGSDDLGEQQFSRILVRVNNWNGDVILATPALAALRARYPSARIIILARPWVEPVLKYNPSIDEVYIYQDTSWHKGVRGFLRLCSEIRAQKFDGAFLFQNAFDAALIARLARIPMRAGFSTRGRGPLLTHKVAYGPIGKTSHRAERYLKMLTALGLDVPSVGTSLHILPQEMARAREIVGGLGIHEKTFLVGIHPGAKYGALKQWPPERFSALAGWLKRELGATVLLFGSSSDRPIAAQVMDRIPGGVIDFTGRISVRDSLAIISDCSLFVSNESEFMHAAAALSVPIVSIFGPADPVLTAPYRAKHRVVYKGVECSPCRGRSCRKDHVCMREIKVEEVAESVGDLIEETGIEIG